MLIRRFWGHRIRFLGLSALGAWVLLGLPACGPREPEAAGSEAIAGCAGRAENVGGSGAGEAGSPATAGEAGSAGEAGTGAVPDLPWNEHSQHIELDCFGFFQGPMLFSADRDQLSVAQLALVEDLRRTEPSEAPCSSDPLNCDVAITSDEGIVTHYRANESDAACYGEAKPALLRASVDALLDSVDCKFAFDETRPLSPSIGCFHGMRFASPLHQPLLLLEANRSYHVEIDYWGETPVTLELFGTDSSQPLAVGAPTETPGPRGSRFVTLDVEVEAPLIADLVITPKAAVDNDFYLNFH